MLLGDVDDNLGWRGADFIRKLHPMDRHITTIKPFAAVTFRSPLLSQNLGMRTEDCKGESCRGIRTYPAASSTYGTLIEPCLGAMIYSTTLSMCSMRTIAGSDAGSIHAAFHTSDNRKWDVALDARLPQTIVSVSLQKPLTCSVLGFCSVWCAGARSTLCKICSGERCIWEDVVSAVEPRPSDPRALREPHDLHIMYE